MTSFASYEEFLEQSPLDKYSFYASGRVHALLQFRTEILDELDAVFPNDSTIVSEHLSRAESLLWRWIMGGYKVVRTMCQAEKCFSDRARVELSALKRELSTARRRGQVFQSLEHKNSDTSDGRFPA